MTDILTWKKVKTRKLYCLPIDNHTEIARLSKEAHEHGRKYGEFVAKMRW
jgi:hypothetical protein